MYFRTNKQTGKVYTGKVCNPSEAAPSEAQKRVKTRFAKITAAVIELLSDPAEHSKWQKAYLAQHKIGSLHGYVFAKIKDQFDENGEKLNV
jgi:hypothetical protein